MQSGGYGYNHFFDSINHYAITNMTNPFKYGRIFDSTIFCLVTGLVLLLPWTISFCHRSGEELHTERRALIASGTLTTDSVGVGSVAVNRGDTVTVMGLVNPDTGKRPMLWVETSNGVRGYLPEECVADSAYVKSRSLNFSKDSTGYSANHQGDTIVVKKITLDKNKIAQCLVRLPSGKDTLLRNTPFVFFLSDSLVNYTIDIYGDNMEPMSVGKFEKLCLGKKFGDLERDIRPALEVGRTKGGTLQARYPALVFKEGKFYTPIVEFDADSVVTSYRLPERASRTMNNWVLKYIPFYGKFCDLPLVGSIWSNGIYEASALPISRPFINRLDLNGFSMKTIGSFLLFFVLVILLACRAAFTPLLVPWLCFGLLRFPPVFKRVDNQKMYFAIKIMALLAVVLWVFVTLSNYYIILTLIGVYLAYKFFIRKVRHVLLERCPEVRCSLCKMLYSTEFTERVQEGEPRGAVEEVEEILNTVVTSVERWQTYDEVTTTYGDGHKTTSRENVKNHKAEHGYNVVGVFMETVNYVPYVNYYTCAECGGQETSTDIERQVLKRTKLREYHSYF